MTIDPHGIIRDSTGRKVAVFRDCALGQRFIELAALLDGEQAAAMVREADSDHPVALKREIYWRVM